ncbi:hypothetical protein PILCRDRAFT_691 [Piloderma croceum F 1598]|uniref:Uncharacterized protein n=1 Tax=Piloderma croceum (strain F 1598) TaxID=765440 RepID=A0A0C3GLS9_PILCF|nr:hypothetical protein PILCRDRAFT_691 [Piloderma croceum F 1598]
MFFCLALVASHSFVFVSHPASKSNLTVARRPSLMASLSPRQASSPLSRGPSSLLVSETFKPKLPLDPFIAVPQPWSLKLDTVISALNAHCRRDVLLILGAPPLRDLEPLLQSQYLESSLLILATHQPPDISPASTVPAVRILRLSSPLAVQDAGAVRFVNVLECAERVARVWRKSGGEGVEELSEAELDGAAGPGSLSPPTVFRFTPSESVPTSPHSSTERLPSSRPTTPHRRRLRSASSLTFSKIKGKSLPPIDSSQRPFDCILNFLPTNVSDKAILKQTILVTTISRPFLTAASNPSRQATSCRSSSRLSVGAGANEEGRRWSTLLGRKSIYSAPSSNQSRASLYSSPGSPSYMASSVPQLPRRAHLVHLVPPTSPSASRSKLMQSMEGFLCSFAYPNPLDIGQPDLAGMERAAPFLMHPYTLRSAVRHAAPSLMPPTISSENVASEWTIADLLLSGALDRSTSSVEGDRSPPRAWIASAKDITFVPASKPGSMRSVNVAQPIPAAAIRERQRDSSFMNDTVDGPGLVRYESSSGTGESAGLGDSGAMTPESTPPSTPDTIVATPTSQMEKVFRFSHFRAGGRGAPIAPDSDESESTESTRESVPQPIRSRSLSMLLTPRRLRSEPGIVKQGNGWNSKWKFWKVSFTAAASA